MEKINLLFCLLLCFNIVVGQTDEAVGYAATITSNDLKKHLTILAGDEMEGRETGTVGQRKAAAYIEAQFKLMGLKQANSLKGYQQLYALHQDSIISSELIVNDQIAIYGKDYISPAGSNESERLTGKKIVFAGYGIADSNYNDYKDLDVSGKIVVFFLGEPKRDGKYIISGTTRSGSWTYPGLNKKLQVAREKGAAGAFIINPAQDTFSLRAVQNSKKTDVIFPRNITGAKPVNYVILSHTYAKNLLENNFDTLLKQIKLSQPIDATWLTETNAEVSLAYSKYRTTTDASNVIGVVEGLDKKDEYVFVTAHYDHLGKKGNIIYYGADDDGSGTCAVLEMADAFAQAQAAGKGPRRTVVFMTVSGEEKGLWGSEYYSDHPVFALEKTSVDLNIDMVGRIDTERKTGDTLNYIYVIGHDKLSTDLPIINEGVNKKYTNLVFDYKFDDPTDHNRIYYRSDHYNFARKGVPVLFFYDGMLQADYHKPTDTVDKIYWDLYEKRTRMIFHTAWEIANRDHMLKRDLPLPTGQR